jgi:hypothetical protein
MPNLCGDTVDVRPSRSPCFLLAWCVFSHIWRPSEICAQVVSTFPAISWLSCPLCPVQVTNRTGLSSPIYPDYPVPVVHSQMFCPRFPVLTCLSSPDPSVPSRLSCPDCPVLAVLLQLPCPGNLVHCSPDATATSWHLCPFQAHLSKLTCQADLSRLSCPQMSYLYRHVVPSRLSCLSCPILAVMFWVFCLCPAFTIPSIFSGFLSQLSCPGFTLLAVLSRLSCL